MYLFLHQPNFELNLILVIIKNLSKNTVIHYRNYIFLQKNRKSKIKKKITQTNITIIFFILIAIHLIFLTRRTSIKIRFI